MGVVKTTRQRPKVIRRTATASGLIVAAVVVSGCGGTPSTGTTPAPAVTAGQTLADLTFTARTVTGAAFEGKQLVGKPTVLWFWSPWCPTCRAQAGWVSALAEKYVGKVNVVGVGGLDESAAIRDYGAGLSSFPQLDDARGDVWTRFGVIVQSSYVVLDAAGRVQFQGYLDNDELDRRVDQLVG
ncbi:thiol-disulfide isomerase/thioredoxin [Kribbella sp. VKM Ac-2527]|uniref:Thiol-disulfide isomerase/thioredoxin n=1 Tax=Kribbella caucasensis TaxID=2512215 RepID=A0A4R6J4V4_9ACTN|nr:thiol-disulfide isomerase/thioredoxin [Kribbella sp. VKM Ac-2527]